MAERIQHTLYQVSTATALVEGIYQGAVRVAALRDPLFKVGVSRRSNPRGIFRTSACLIDSVVAICILAFLRYA